MKPSTFSAIITALLCAGMALSGCGRSSAKGHEHAHEHEPAATYKEGHGIQLSKAGEEFLKVETGEVGAADVAPARNVMAVPASALLRTVKGDFVYVVNGRWYLRTPVTVGASDGAKVEVREGLYEGDRIVTVGTHGLWLAEIHAVNGGMGCAHGH